MKEAIFYKVLNQLQFWDSRNTQITGYCKGIKQAKMTLQMIELSKGVKQTLLIK